LIWFPSIPFADKIVWVAITNAFASLYIFFSVYYQWKVAKQWCPLCLTVQVVLLLELLWCVVNFWTTENSFSPLIADIASIRIFGLFFCVLLPILAWYGIKPLWVKSKNADLYYSAYKRLQYNP
jgi:hypothetical protein